MADEFVVRGEVRYRGGFPIAGLSVTVKHRELRREVDLGSAITDTAGRYSVTYAMPGADLIVRVLNGTGGHLAESPVVYGAGPVEEVSIEVDGGPATTWSEYEQLMVEVAPHLGPVEPEDLTEREGQPDVSLLVGKTGQPAERVVAHKVAAEADLPADALYGLFRKGLPTNVSALLATAPGDRREALREAVEERLVPGILGTRIDEIDERFTDASAGYVASERGGGTPLRAVLEMVLPDLTVRQRFVTRYVKHTGPVRGFWQAIRTDPAFAGKVPDLQLTLQLAALTGGHAPLVAALRRRRARGEFATLRRLTRHDAAGWAAIIRDLETPAGQRVPPDITGATPDERIDTYAETLVRVMADALPAQTLAHRAQRDVSQSNDLRRFWTNVTTAPLDFELSKVDVRTFFDTHPELMAGVGDRGAAVATTQRVFNLTRRYDETRALVDAGFRSATAIAATNRDAFAQRHAGLFADPTRALAVYDKAAQVAAHSLAFVAAFGPQFNLDTTAVTLTPGPKAVPNLTQLFGGQDMCDCSSCRSVAGPAAYHTELLAFLRERRLVGVSDALAVLLKRRPDLVSLELSCANTNTVLPYLDLVNEILENTVAPIPAVSFPLAVQSDLDARHLPESMRPGFATSGHPLTGGHIVVVIDPGKHRLVTDGSVLFDLRGQSGEITVTAVGYQMADVNGSPTSPHRHGSALDIGRYAGRNIHYKGPTESGEAIAQFYEHMLGDDETGPVKVEDWGSGRADLARWEAELAADSVAADPVAGDPVGRWRRRRSTGCGGYRTRDGCGPDLQDQLGKGPLIQRSARTPLAHP